MAATLEDTAASQIDALHHRVRELEEQNDQLRQSAADFGALAERLNAQLMLSQHGASAGRQWTRPSADALLKWLCRAVGTRSWTGSSSTAL
jgi:hypothetical protein